MGNRYCTLILLLAVFACGTSDRIESPEDGVWELSQASRDVSIDDMKTVLPLFNVEGVPPRAIKIHAWIADSDRSQWRPPAPATQLEIDESTSCLIEMQDRTRVRWDDPAHTVDLSTLELAYWEDGGAVGFVLASQMLNDPLRNGFLYVLDMQQCEILFVEYESNPVRVTFETSSGPVKFDLKHHDPDNLRAEFMISTTGRQIAQFYKEAVDQLSLEGGEEVEVCVDSVRQAPLSTYLPEICDLHSMKPYSTKAYTRLKFYDFTNDAVENFRRAENDGSDVEGEVYASPAGDALVTGSLFVNKEKYILDGEFVKHISTKHYPG